LSCLSFFPLIRTVLFSCTFVILNGPFDVSDIFYFCAKKYVLLVVLVRLLRLLE
jgi:hypothetical protein